MSGIKLAQAPKEYDRQDQSQVRKALEQADAENYKKGEDIRMERGTRLIMKADTGGQRWRTYVDASGRLCTETVT